MDKPRLCDSTKGVVANAGDNREEEITPYLNRSANACVRRDTRSEEKNELRDCIILLGRRERNGGNGMKIHEYMLLSRECCDGYACGSSPEPRQK